MDEDEIEIFESRASRSPDSEDVFDSALSSAATGFDSSLRTKFSEVEYKKLRTIGAFIMRGLSLREACVLARIVPDKLTALIDSNEDVAAFIEFKQIAYKASLLQTVAISGTAGKNVKSAGYLLENQFRSDFGKKAADAPGDRSDALADALEFIRENGDKESMIRTLPEGSVRTVEAP